MRTQPTIHDTKGTASTFIPPHSAFALLYTGKASKLRVSEVVIVHEGRGKKTSLEHKL
jgi:hypothetical protein